MGFLNGITILLLYQLVGEVSVLLLNFPIPGPVVGMVLLFVTLAWRKNAGESLNTASSSLLSHLSLLFIPAGVGVIVHFETIINEWLSISVALVLSTLLTMAATAAIMLAVSRLMGKRSN